MYHLEKDSVKGAQTGGVSQLGLNQGCSTWQGWLESESCSLMRLLAQRELTSTTTNMYMSGMASFHPLLCQKDAKVITYHLQHVTLTPAESPLFQKFNTLWRLGK